MDSTPRFGEPDFATPAGETNGAAAGPDALREASRHFRELTEYAKHFLVAKADATRLQVRRALVMAALGVLGLFVGVGGLIAAAVLTLTGIAGGLGELTGRLWLGELIVGLVVVLAAAGIALVVLSRIRRSSFRATLEKYEQRKQHQRWEFGHDVDQVARDA